MFAWFGMFAMFSMMPIIPMAHDGAGSRYTRLDTRLENFELSKFSSVPGRGGSGMLESRALEFSSVPVPPPYRLNDVEPQLTPNHHNSRSRSSLWV